MGILIPLPMRRFKLFALIAIFRYDSVMGISTLSYLSNAAECLKILAHPKRLYILTLLRDTPNLSVGEIAKVCKIQSHVASEHLRLMHRCGFLSYTKEGRTTMYKVVEPHVFKILECIEAKFKKGKRVN